MATRTFMQKGPPVRPARITVDDQAVIILATADFAERRPLVDRLGVLPGLPRLPGLPGLPKLFGLPVSWIWLLASVGRQGIRSGIGNESALGFTIEAILLEDRSFDWLLNRSMPGMRQILDALVLVMVKQMGAAAGKDQTTRHAFKCFI